MFEPTAINTNLQLQCSDGVVSKHLLVHNSDLKGSIRLTLPCLRPVLLTLPLDTLHHIGEHGNGLDLLLPHQPPEVNNSVGQWACVIRLF